jgi:two-component system response regulator CpxR
MEPDLALAKPPSKSTVLIVDDDHELCVMLAEYLAPEGLSVETAGDGRAALERLQQQPPDIVVLDVMLPELTGFEVLRRIRVSSRLPVIMLTARGEDVDRIVGLEMGADDYLSKPFNPRELAARIKAVLRRTSGDAGQAGPHSNNNDSSSLEWGPVRIDFRARRAAAGGRNLELTAAELRILEQLMRADAKPVTRDDLMIKTLGRRLFPTDRSLDTHISNLRRKLAKVTDRVTVHSVRGTGYALALASARGDSSPEP